jgi:hypothetical protein
VGKGRKGIGWVWAGTGSCMWMGACDHDWVWGGDKGGEEAGPGERFSRGRAKGPSGKEGESGEVSLGVTTKAWDHQQDLSGKLTEGVGC